MAGSNDIKRMALMFPQSIELEHYKSDVYMRILPIVHSRGTRARGGSSSLRYFPLDRSTTVHG